MEKIQLGKSGLNTSRLIYGCMRITGDNSPSDREKGKQALRSAIEAGYNHFDHADIYAGGLSESLFAEVLKESPGLREQLIITSKAGIRAQDTPKAGDPKCYDFSRDYLVSSVDGILGRLDIESLDLFLLHRPDYLFNAAEVAETFMQLHRAGKVKHFGVSNFTPSQVSLLQSALPVPLQVNQVEINIHNINSFTDGTLDLCQQSGITPVAWCPLGGVAYSAWGNTFSAADEQRIENELSLQAEKYGCQPWQVILAWLLKHPAQICPIIGSTTPERIVAARQSLELDYSREDWYRLLEARNGEAVP
ncbi:aldo/keto reductase [Thalassomonas viridans]|uniref:Aldo/keto reductase n=1 Tax=Thalassomonas viridans TaxID=137584 RepID=A0AAE9Z020_9GAMM|nr:aldo/keto reductase [Thalassomonas viridans]WDE04311.1 aldo/keto reductase [Thalassomonas viridans]